MSQSKVLVYSGQSRARRVRFRGFVPVREVGLWDLDLIIGDLPSDLPAMLQKLAPLPMVSLYAVVAPVPIGIVAAGSLFDDQKPRLLVNELMPHATRVAEHLGLDELIAFTPWQLVAPQPWSHHEGRVRVISMEQYLGKRKRKGKKDARILDTAFDLVPLVRKREIVPG